MTFRRLVLAPNPGPMTLDGTNTWLLAQRDARGGSGVDAAVVVDPGPLHEDHLRAVADAAVSEGLRVELVLLTHGHPDHAEGAARFAQITGARVRALDPGLRLGGEGLTDGDRVRVAGLEVLVVGTPGHTSDSLSFLLPDDGSLLTGDTVLGRGTSVVAHPDGRLGPYLDSLQRLSRMAARGAVRRILPGHGPVLERPSEVLTEYLDHRRERLGQVEAALASGARTPREVVEVVYADVDQALWSAAELSVRAQLEYLGVGPTAPGGSAARGR